MSDSVIHQLMAGRVTLPFTQPTYCLATNIMPISIHQKIVLASGNAGKIKEIQSILNEYQIVPQSEFKIEEAEETGSTFVENAIIKARNATLHCGLPVIADDSGLVVDALDGAPGVISARYAGINATDDENLQKLLKDLENIPEGQRSARFVCVMVYMQHANDPLPIVTQGVWDGYILNKAVGKNGFGYDPIFWLPTHQRASAELSPVDKNAVSHRGKALRQLTQLIQAIPS